ncbi:MAG: restriction endonuclease subunit S [Candidatus Methanoperedens sp.]|nr:restriction endonuclease subunit S [Candidatus Methanoperedens sp.]
MNVVLKPGWNYRKLDDLGFIGRGKSKHRPRDDPSLYGGKYPFIQTGEVKAANLYISQYSQTYNENGLSQSKLWRPETLLITIAANIAETAILKIEACFPDSIVGFVADPKKADVRFVKYCMDTMKLRMQNVSKGTTQDNLSLDKLLTFDFLVPPLPTQRKIAAILSAYDDLIENNTRRIKILEEMTQALYREWFVKFRFPGHETVRMVESELGMVPEGWKIKKLGDIVKNVRISVIPGPQTLDLPYVPIDCLPRKSLALLESKPGSEAQSSLFSFKKYDILFGAMRSYFHKVVMAPFDGTTRSTCFVLRPIEEINYSYAVLTLFEESTVSYSSKQSRGTTIPYAVWDGALENMPIVMPPEELRSKINRTVKPILERIAISLFRQTNLRRTRDLLLPKLISGEVDMEKLDINIPAEAA